MPKKTPVILLILVCLLGAYIWFVERHRGSSHDQQEEARRTLQFEPDDIVYLRMEQKRRVLEAERSGEDWKLIQPIEVRVRSAEIRRLLAGLAGLPRGDVITAKQMRLAGHTLVDYGLNRPRARVTLGDQFSRFTWLVGRDAPVGDMVFVMKEGGEDIVLTSNQLLKVIPEDLDTLRDRTLFQGELPSVQRLDVKINGTLLQVQRGETGAWRVLQPFSARAEREAVNQLLRYLMDYQVETFVKDGLSDTASYGIDEESSFISMRFAGEDAPQVLQLGTALENAPDQRYSRMADEPSVTTVDTGICSVAYMDLNLLRDRRLLPWNAGKLTRVQVEKDGAGWELSRPTNGGGAWELKQPREEAADATAMVAFLQGLANIRVSEYLSDEDPASVTSSATRISATLTGQQTNDLVKWVWDAQKPDEPFVKLWSDEAGLVEIRPDSLSVFSVAPLHFKDRNILVLDPESVRSIVRWQPGSTQELKRAESGAFELQSPMTGQVDEESAAALLAQVTRVRAASFIEVEEDRLPDFFNGEPRLSLTFTLSGEAGIRKTLQLGEPTSDGGSYGRIRGQEVLFILDKATVATLMNPLVVPAAADASPAGGTP